MNLIKKVLITLLLLPVGAILLLVATMFVPSSHWYYEKFESTTEQPLLVNQVEFSVSLEGEHKYVKGFVRKYRNVGPYHLALRVGGTAVETMKVAAISVEFDDQEHTVLEAPATISVLEEYGKPIFKSETLEIPFTDGMKVKARIELEFNSGDKQTIEVRFQGIQKEEHGSLFDAMMSV